uniref:SDR family NAD(P)-dependent oxidoreductase n=1 Tax=Falsiroseomonas oryzae TaxID=2766473 RepID=UPI0022EA9A79
MQAGALSGLEALVTGGGTGIGAACAAALTAAGARVTVMGRREAPLRAMVERGMAEAALPGDVT